MIDITKEYIEENLLDKNNNLLFKKLKEINPKISKEELYNIYHNNEEPFGFCKNNHKLKFISFTKGYQDCRICEDLNGFYNIERLKKYTKNNILLAGHVKKIKEYYSINLKTIYLWNNKKEYCPICSKENIFINLKKGYAKTCSQECSAKLPRRKLTLKEKEIANSKRTKTNMGRYNVKSNLSLIDKTGANNPIHKQEVKNKIRKTCLKKYGVSHHFKNIEIQKKRIESRSRKTYTSIFGEHIKREHFYNIKDFNESFIKENFIKEGVFDKNSFEEYFNCSPNTTLRILRYFDLWDNKMSLPEQIVSKYLEGFVKTKKIISPYELDFYSYKHKFAIEVNGDYWHSVEAGTDPNYHEMKANRCSNIGVSLYQFFEREILEKEDIIASMIENKLGKSKKIYARKCIIKEISTKEAKDFLEKNHMQGYARSKIKIGLYYNDILIEVITLGKPRFNKNVEYELIRLCTKKFHVVVGGFSKLLNYFEKKYNPKSLLSYANRRWSEGSSYKKLGFKKIRVNKPNFFYYKKGQYYHRQFLQTHKLKSNLDKYNSLLSPKENIKENGYYTLYDAGHIVYVKKY